MGGKHGTACQGRLIGTWPTTDEGGRVDQLFHAGAGEDYAEQIAAVVIDDPAGPAGVAVGVQAGPGHHPDPPTTSSGHCAGPSAACSMTMRVSS
jgi:hypothetical protein